MIHVSGWLIMSTIEDDGFVGVVQGIGLFPSQVGAARRKLNPDMRLCRFAFHIGEFADEAAL
jgi:hypothetical protein